ncbi:hypothetical protein IPZ58_30865 [Streptomyces roseoverticillatus]|uniref:SH3 domain-containing protein n=1 Tax=Streptomyces roseoverticillatus TaxID=66429 RepID=UPI001F321A98|nr:SH3 domain-containing protein [Streptomyces roseoverticillatus]MCF3105946.1 hypothetical protein [Streptomyces roseoverticillatus]
MSERIMPSCSSRSARTPVICPASFARRCSAARRRFRVRCRPAYADDVYGLCTGEGVRIRAAASTSSSAVGLCYSDHRLAHRDVSGDGQWDKVYDVNTGASGWISHGYWSW